MIREYRSETEVSGMKCSQRHKQHGGEEQSESIWHRVSGGYHKLVKRTDCSWISAEIGSLDDCPLLGEPELVLEVLKLGAIHGGENGLIKLSGWIHDACDLQFGAGHQVVHQELLFSLFERRR